MKVVLDSADVRSGWRGKSGECKVKQPATQ
jgi:hypothetical protein